MSNDKTSEDNPTSHDEAGCSHQHAESAIGDCDRCGHSILYHAPLVGCMKCSCDEYA